MTSFINITMLIQLLELFGCSSFQSFSRVPFTHNFNWVILSTHTSTVQVAGRFMS